MSYSLVPLVNESRSCDAIGGSARDSRGLRNPVSYPNVKSARLAIRAGYMWINRVLKILWRDRAHCAPGLLPARPQRLTSTAGPDRHRDPPLTRRAPLKTSRYHCIMAPGLAAATEPHHTATASTAGIAVYHTDRKAGRSSAASERFNSQRIHSYRCSATSPTLALAPNYRASLATPRSTPSLLPTLLRCHHLGHLSSTCTHATVASSRQETHVHAHEQHAQALPPHRTRRSVRTPHSHTRFHSL